MFVRRRRPATEVAFATLLLCARPHPRAVAFALDPLANEAAWRATLEVPLELRVATLILGPPVTLPPSLRAPPTDGAPRGL